MNGWASFRTIMFLLVLTSAAMASNTWYVDGVNGNDNDNCESPQTACKTIGHAISLASSGDSTMVAPATYTENLTISISLTITGAGVSTTIIDGGGVNTVVTISSAATNVTFSGLTIRNGSAQKGGGINNNGSTLTINDSSVSENVAVTDCIKCFAQGGGIYNYRGTLAINRSVLSNNSATASCHFTKKGSCGGGGGGIVNNNGTLTISNSTLSKNSARVNCEGVCVEFGGGIWMVGGILTVNKSTLAENSVDSDFGGYGGGIYSNTGTLTINNSTISGNSASGGYSGAGGAINNGGTLTISNSTLSGNQLAGQHHLGGAIIAGGTVTLQNTIVANSVNAKNCYGTVTSNGYNLGSDNSCNFNGPGDMNNTKAKLGKLGDHGGPTQTIPLLSGSPAIDAGNPNGCTDGSGKLLKTDQRGKPRPDHEDTGGCDMGRMNVRAIKFSRLRNQAITRFDRSSMGGIGMLGELAQQA